MGDRMSGYERCKLEQLCDIIDLEGIPTAALLRECSEIIRRRLIFDDRRPAPQKRPQNKQK